jgi:hypothetical protein
LLNGFWPAKAAGQGCGSQIGGCAPAEERQMDRQTGWLWMDEIGGNDAHGGRSGAASEERLDWKREVVAAAEEGCQIRGVILEVPFACARFM